MGINQSVGAVGAPSAASNSAARQQRPGFWLWIDHAALDAALSINTAALAVYITMCRYASNDQTCFPSLDTIVKHVRASKRTVIRAIRALEQAGLIRKVSRRHPKSGGTTSNLYKLLNLPPNDPATPEHPGECHSGPTPGDTRAPGGVSQRTHELTVEGLTVDEPDVIEPEESFTLSSASADTRAPKIDASRSTKSAPDSRLVDLVERFNSLPDDIRPPKTRITPKLEARFRSAMKTPELREALSDPERIVAAFRRAEYAHGKRWANIWGLLSTKLNSAGEYKLVYLLDGGYDNREETGKQTRLPSSELFPVDF